MKRDFLPVFATWTLLFLSPATAGNYVVLTDAEMDRVAAGAAASAVSAADALGNLAAETVPFTLGAADSAHQSALAIGLSTATAASFLSPAVATSVSSVIARSP